MRIAIVAACPFPLPRGTPVRIQRTAEALADLGHEVHVITYHLGSGETARGVQVHRIADVPSYRKLSPGPTYGKLLKVDPPLARLLRATLRAQRFDVIHAHHYEGLLVGAFARRGLDLPLVYDAHTLLASELPYYGLGLPAGLKRAVGRRLDHALPMLADHTACVTETIRDKLVRDSGLDPSRVSVVPNGVEYEHFDPAPYAGAPRGAGKRLIFTGNLAEYQGIDHLLNAFARTLARIPDARLTIASDSPFAPYETLAAQLGVRERIDLVDSPRFAELPALLAAADVAVNPRVDCDGVPVKLLNYMASGRAVVSYASSAPGVIHRQTGWLAASGDAAALAEGMTTLLEQPALASELGRNARRYIDENCRWSITAERCVALYRTLLAGRG